MLRDINQYQSSSLEETDYVIYATPVICITLLPKIFLSLYQKYPMVKFNVIEMLPPKIADEVELGGNAIGILSIADFLLRETQRLKDPSVCFEPKLRDRLMLNVRQDSVLAKKRRFPGRTGEHSSGAPQYGDHYDGAPAGRGCI